MSVSSTIRYSSINMNDLEAQRVVDEPPTRHVTTCEKILSVPYVVALTALAEWGIYEAAVTLGELANPSARVMVYIPFGGFALSALMYGVMSIHAIVSDCSGGGTRECAPGGSFDPCG